jgi:hypothetical protein
MTGFALSMPSGISIPAFSRADAFTEVMQIELYKSDMATSKKLFMMYSDTVNSLFHYKKRFIPCQ